MRRLNRTCRAVVALLALTPLLSAAAPPAKPADPGPAVVPAAMATLGRAGEPEQEKIAPAKAAARPNILLIMTDQQHGGMMRCAGNPYLKTPAMDSLAATGMRFERASCANGKTTKRGRRSRAEYEGGRSMNQFPCAKLA